MKLDSLNKKQVLTTVGLFVGSVILLKVTFALLSTINDIPFLGNIFELIGMAYTFKLIITNLKAEQRQHTISTAQQALEDVGLVEQAQTVIETIKTVVEAAKPSQDDNKLGKYGEPAYLELINQLHSEQEFMSAESVEVV
jgi:hypothetical protein